MFTIVKTIQDDLGKAAEKNERTLLLGMKIWFNSIVEQIQRDLRTKYAKSITSELTDWELIESSGKKILKPVSLRVMQSGGNAAYKSLALTGSFDVLNVEAVKAADKLAAKLVTNVTKETKAGIRTFVSAGIKEGKSMPKIARELRPLVGLTKPQVESVANYRALLGDKEKFPKLTAGDIDRKVQRYTDKTHRRRMDTIARTETARAQNVGYVQGLAENGVTEVEFSAEPDACPECTALNSEKFPVEEAQDIIPVHPRCRCAMLPVIGEKTVEDKGEYNRNDLPATMQAPEGLPGWKKYNGMHPEQTSQESLYDWYKLKYETDSKLSPSAARFLTTNAKRFEAKSVKITKPIPGVSTTTITPAEVRVLPKPKPTRGVKPEPSAIPEGQGVPVRANGKKFTLDDESTIQTYTFNWHEPVVQYQAGLPIDPVFMLSPEKIGAFTHRMENAVLKLPGQQGTFHRGMAFKTKSQRDAFLKKMKVDDIYTSPSFQSVSKDSGKISYFAGPKQKYPFENGLQIHIEGSSARSIGKYSSYPNEKEFLFMRGSRFKVIKWKEEAFGIGVPQKKSMHIYLREVGAKPKPKIVPKSYFDKSPKGWEERHLAHKAELEKSIGIDFKALKMGQTDLPEYKAALAKFEKAMKSGATTKKIPSEIRKPNYEGFSTKKPVATKNLNAYYDTLEEIGGDDVIEHYGTNKVSIRMHQGNYRANADPRFFDIDMSTANQFKIYFHELGHLLEQNTNVAFKAKRWVRARGGGAGKAVPYNKISSYSHDMEKAYKDKFIDPYVGKFYSNGHTEVMSMGMQQFTSYKQMMRFAKKDFDHFSFIHGILTGAI